jgi:hypothetical protein
MKANDLILSENQNSSMVLNAPIDYTSKVSLVSYSNSSHDSFLDISYQSSPSLESLLSTFKLPSTYASWLLFTPSKYFKDVIYSLGRGKFLFFLVFSYYFQRY